MSQQKAVTILLIMLFSISVIKTGLDITQRQNPENQAENFSATTIEVIDGDTIDIDRTGVEDTVRILGIDTPETQAQNIPSEFYMENTSKNRKCLRKIGEKASQLLKQKILDKEVKIVTDVKSDRRGSYGRLLAYIEYNQTDIGQKMLEKGYARVYNSTFTQKQKYRKLETKSQEKERGIWNTNCGK